MKNFLFTSESVTEGHPDKLCDKISDSILNYCLSEDKNSRVAIETMAKDNKIILSGELTTKADIDYKEIVKNTLKEIGYDDPELGISHDNFEIELNISKQSEDISRGVDDKEYENKLDDSQGAGDQGLVFGYATNETEHFMPITSHYANLLAKRLAKVRKEGIINGLGPDGKTQVTMEFDKDNLKPKRIDTVVLSTQHNEEKNYDTMREEIIEKVIKPICSEYIDEDTSFLINPTGKFIKGGPIADCGLTGRKIIVDTYGGVARHGGGAFSGKDPSKTDRSAAYAARYAAKNIVAAGLCDKCEIQISYAIGISEPVSIYVNTFNTEKIDKSKIEEVVLEKFPLKPKDIITELDLLNQDYIDTSSYGHFGNNKYSWEKLDKVEEIKSYLN